MAEACCLSLGSEELHLQNTRVGSSSGSSNGSSGGRSGGSSPDCVGDRKWCERAKLKKPGPGLKARSPLHIHGTGLLLTSPRSKVLTNSSSGSPEPRDLSASQWEVTSLRRDLELAQDELRRCRHLVTDLQDRETKMKDRLSEQAQRMLERGVRFEDVSLGERRPTALIRRYGNLYAQARVDTLDALDALHELRDGDELKSKLLFSVVVLAFRSIQGAISEMRTGVRRILQIPDPPDLSSRDLETSLSSYLRDSVDRFDVRKSVEEVCSQIWATLYDYPCLKSCDGLIQYVRDCVRLAWGLSNQQPPFVIEYETRTFRRDMHVRFHASSQDAQDIKTYLWPSLLEGQDGPCVHKGVVVT